MNGDHTPLPKIRGCWIPLGSKWLLPSSVQQQLLVHARGRYYINPVFALNQFHKWFWVMWTPRFCHEIANTTKKKNNQEQILVTCQEVVVTLTRYSLFVLSCRVYLHVWYELVNYCFYSVRSIVQCRVKTSFSINRTTTLFHFIKNKTAK